MDHLDARREEIDYMYGLAALEGIEVGGRVKAEIEAFVEGAQSAEQTIARLKAMREGR